MAFSFEETIIILVVVGIIAVIISFFLVFKDSKGNELLEERPVHERWLCCSNCGKKNEPRMSYCINCGEKLPGSGKYLPSIPPLTRGHAIQPPKNAVPLSHGDLSRFWYCPEDGTRLGEYSIRSAGNPYFTVGREKMIKGINDAIVMGKIPHGAFDQTRGLLEYIFNNSNFFNAELVCVQCPTCKRIYSAPKM